MPRHVATTALLDSEEREWWADNADLEDRYCWVQTPAARRILRGHYVRRIRRFVGTGGHLLELGSGTGWLGIELAGPDGRLLGLDSAPEQVARARAAAAEKGLGARAEYEEAGTPGADRALAGRAFDAVITHAFLHHLSTAEIEEVLSEARSRLRPGGALVVLEPVVGADATVSVQEAQGPDPTGRAMWLQQRLRHLPVWLGERHLRRMGGPELAVRRRLEARALPEPPFGPSPKETPFRPGELEDLLSGAGFSVEEARPVMCMSHLVAQDVLLAGLSQPRFWRVAALPLFALARVVDHLLLESPARPPGLWVFTLYLCRRPT